MIEGTAFATIGSDTLDISLVDSSRILILTSHREIQPGDSIRLFWKSAQISPISEYSYYTPYIPHPDSLINLSPQQSSGKASSPLDQWGELRRSGSIIRGIRFGEAGNSASSGLHLEMSGRLAPNVNLDALVDDRSLPATSEGSSTTLRELDRLRVQVSTPTLTGILGDWDLNWRSGRYGSIERRLKGGEVTARRGGYQASAAVAGGGGRFASSLITGRGGDQGPYELSDRYGSIGIQIVAGSEKVRLDGRLLTRGLEADYRIEYDRGRILFNPKALIQEGSRIEVEYEVIEEAYSSNFYGVRAAAKGKGWSVESMIAQEGLDQNHPLAFDWTPDFRMAAEQAGDDPQGAATNGVDSVGIGKGDYVWGSASDASQILIFSPPDSVGRPTGYLRADFTLDPVGGYLRFYDKILQAFYYHWEGVGQGDFSPVRRLPLPDRTRIGQVYAAYRGAKYSSDIEIAGSEYDGNLLSTKGDSQNRTGAVNWRGGWSSLDSIVSAAIVFRRQGAGFRTFSRSHESDYRYRWGLSDETSLSGETAIESEAALRPDKSVKLAASVGKLDLGEHFTGLRAGVVGNAATGLYAGRVEIVSVITDDDSIRSKGRSDRYSAEVQRLKGILIPSLRLRYEKNQTRRSDSLTDGNRLNEIEPGLEINPANWTKVRLGFIYREDDAVSDAAYVANLISRSVKAGWEGRVLAAIWSMSAARTEESLALQGNSSITSTQGAASLDAGRRTSPFHFRGSYNLSTGSGRAEAWVATYVGTGRGSYKREGDRYVPDENGDFDLTHVPTDTIRFATRVQFSGKLDWRSTARGDSVPPPFGLSGTNTYFDAAATTYDADPTEVFLLTRSAFRSTGISSMRWNWRQDVNFLEGNAGGDGRLSLRRDESRDAGLAGGEENLTESASLRIRIGLTRRSTLTVEPMTDRTARRTISNEALRASVRSTGGDAEIAFPAPGNSEASLRGGLERRREAVTGGSVTERRIAPSLRLPLRAEGSVRLEGEWRQLTGSGKVTGYDLTRGWSIGDNWTASASLDYRIGKNLTASALLRSRWQERRAPLVSGLAEMTATL